MIGRAEHKMPSIAAETTEQDHLGVPLTTGTSFAQICSGESCWESRRQKTVSTSTFQSELIALRMTIEKVRGVVSLIRSFGSEVYTPIPILMDNQGVLQALDGDKNIKKKHLVLSFHYIREAVAQGLVKLGYIPSDKNIADLMTKAHGRVIFHRLLGFDVDYKKPSECQQCVIWSRQAQLPTTPFVYQLKSAPQCRQKRSRVSSSMSKSFLQLIC
eukprot:scaffold808_cov194-Pinguiococcus_pyrenoidosus.AAC.8